MWLDFMLLKAVEGAASPERLRAARDIADDPEAPRRALVCQRLGRAAPPNDYVEMISDTPPQDIRLDPYQAKAWNAARATAAPVEWFDARSALVRHVPSEDPDDGLSEVSPENRLAGYDTMDDSDRRAWDAAFHTIASDWLDVVQAEFAGADDKPTASGWGRQTVTYYTRDGGLLLICAAPEGGDYTGVAAWFEAALFVLGEVAEAAGIVEPTYFDVT